MLDNFGRVVYFMKMYWQADVAVFKSVSVLLFSFQNKAWPRHTYIKVLISMCGLHQTFTNLRKFESRVIQKTKKLCKREIRLKNHVFLVVWRAIKIPKALHHSHVVVRQWIMILLIVLIIYMPKKHFLFWQSVKFQNWSSKDLAEIFVLGIF